MDKLIDITGPWAKTPSKSKLKLFKYRNLYIQSFRLNNNVWYAVVVKTDNIFDINSLKHSDGKSRQEALDKVLCWINNRNEAAKV